MTTITTINRPASYEVVVVHESGLQESVCAVYKERLGRYSPSIDEATALFDRVLAECPDAKIIHLQR